MAQARRGLRVGTTTITVELRESPCPRRRIVDCGQEAPTDSVEEAVFLVYGSSRAHLGRWLMAEAAVHIVDGGVARSDLSGRV